MGLFAKKGSKIPRNAMTADSSSSPHLPENERRTGDHFGCQELPAASSIMNDATETTKTASVNEPMGSTAGSLTQGSEQKRSSAPNTAASHQSLQDNNMENERAPGSFLPKHIQVSSMDYVPPKFFELESESDEEGNEDEAAMFEEEISTELDHVVNRIRKLRNFMPEAFTPDRLPQKQYEAIKEEIKFKYPEKLDEWIAFRKTKDGNLNDPAIVPDSKSQSNCEVTQHVQDSVFSMFSGGKTLKSGPTKEQSMGESHVLDFEDLFPGDAERCSRVRRINRDNRNDISDGLFPRRKHPHYSELQELGSSASAQSTNKEQKAEQDDAYMAEWDAKQETLKYKQVNAKIGYKDERDLSENHKMHGRAQKRSTPRTSTHEDNSKDSKSPVIPEARPYSAFSCPAEHEEDEDTHSVYEIRDVKRESLNEWQKRNFEP